MSAGTERFHVSFLFQALGPGTRLARVLLAQELAFRSREAPPWKSCRKKGTTSSLASSGS